MLSSWFSHTFSSFSVANFFAVFVFIFTIPLHAHLHSFPRYIDNVYKKLSHLQALSEKAMERAADGESKRSSLLTELAAVGPQTAALIQFTKALQQRVSCCQIVCGVVVFN